jgi:putative transposase
LCWYRHGNVLAYGSPIRIGIVRKPEGQVGFVIQARPWIVERFLAWINRNRRLAKNVEAIASAEAFLWAASVILPLQSVAR